MNELRAGLQLYRLSESRFGVIILAALNERRGKVGVPSNPERIGIDNPSLKRDIDYGIAPRSDDQGTHDEDDCFFAGYTRQFTFRRRKVPIHHHVVIGELSTALGKTRLQCHGL